MRSCLQIGMHEWISILFQLMLWMYTCLFISTVCWTCFVCSWILLLCLLKYEVKVLLPVWLSHANCVCVWKQFLVSVVCFLCRKKSVQHCKSTLIALLWLHVSGAWLVLQYPRQAVIYFWLQKKNNKKDSFSFATGYQNAMNLLLFVTWYSFSYELMYTA